MHAPIMTFLFFFYTIKFCFYGSCIESPKFPGKWTLSDKRNLSLLQSDSEIAKKRGNFSKLKEAVRFPGWELSPDKGWYGSYIITSNWNWMNSYWIFWTGCLRGAHSVSSFCNFWKMTFIDFTTFSPFWHKQTNVVFLQMFLLLLRSTKAYLCPNWINFDGVDFSEHRSEEVLIKFLLTLSAYFLVTGTSVHHVNWNALCISSSQPVEDYFILL